MFQKKKTGQKTKEKWNTVENKNGTNIISLPLRKEIKSFSRFSKVPTYIYISFVQQKYEKDSRLILYIYTRIHFPFCQEISIEADVNPGWWRILLEMISNENLQKMHSP